MIKCFIIFLLFAGQVFSQTNQNYNKKGIDALLNKDYSKAIEYFTETLKKSPLDAFANYNLACTHAILYRQCEEIVSEDQIYSLLLKAMGSKPSYKNKLLVDEDLEILRGRYKFNEIAGLSKKSILTKIIWYGPSPGVYGPIDQFKFNEDGSFIYTKLAFDDNGMIKREEYNGIYYWESDSHIQIQFGQKSPMAKPVQARKSVQGKYSEGRLEIQDFDHLFSDSNDRCSA
jgi:hypothetical protein